MRPTDITDLTSKSIRGGFAKVFAQAATFLLRVGSLVVLGRLLEPKDFGLVGMVTAVIGILNLIKDFGLSTATIQRETVTDEEISTLFWINLLVGGILGVFCIAVAPIVASFYHEPRLRAVTTVLAFGFLFNAVGVQHTALLQRHMRFTASAAIDVISLFASSTVGVALALRNYGYWSLVAMTIITPLVSTICAWVCTAWIPGMPRKHTGLWSMMRFGGAITLNGLLAYLAYNLEKVLLGRFWGAGALGIYGRGYQLANIPTENLNSAVGGVAFSALSRLQNDRCRLRSYFLKGYSLVLALTLPITMACALFADDLISVLLGPKWTEAGAILRLLAPTILVFAMINPLGWLLFALGLVGRSLRIALVLSPLIVIGYIIGLSHGPKGVAFAYSTVMTLWVIPHIAWCIHGTVISVRDILFTAAKPLLSGLVAAVFAFGIQHSYGHVLPAPMRLLLGNAVLISVYLAILLWVMGQKTFYFDLIEKMRRPSVDEPNLVSA